MNLKHVPGEDRGNLVLYALSTCVWCGKTKKLLNKLGVEYYYVDVDLLKGEERDSVLDEIRKWNPRCSFPTIVVNNTRSILGYDEDEIMEAIEA